MHNGDQAWLISKGAEVTISSGQMQPNDRSFSVQYGLHNDFTDTIPSNEAGVLRVGPRLALLRFLWGGGVPHGDVGSV